MKMRSRFSRFKRCVGDGFKLRGNVVYVSEGLHEDVKLIEERKVEVKRTLFDFIVNHTEVCDQQQALNKYKSSVTDAFCNVNGKLVELFFIIEKDMKNIYAELNKKWKFYGKRKLRSEKFKLEKLQMTVADMSDNIVEFIEYLDLKFKLPEKI